VMYTTRQFMEHSLTINTRAAIPAASDHPLVTYQT
jgi:hypothetical protein